MYLVKSGTLEATQTFANGKETIVASFARTISDRRDSCGAQATCLPHAVTESEVARIRPADFLTTFGDSRIESPARKKTILASPKWLHLKTGLRC